jgi:hypothetical protein
MLARETGGAFNANRYRMVADDLTSMERGAMPSLRRIGTSGGEDVEILQRIASHTNFAVVKDGVYYQAPPPAVELGLRSLIAPFGRGATIDFLSFAPGGKITTVLKLSQYAGRGLDVSPDGRTLLFGQMDGFSEDLLLVENVR